MPNPKRQLPRRVYPLRALGMGLAGLVVGVVLWERNAGLAAWLCMAAISFVWPHVAHLLSRRSADPYRAEIRNLLVDSALAVVLVTLMHFNLLPSVLLVTLTMVDKITTGIRGLWARSLPGMAGAAVAGAAFNGFQWAPETSMPVILACLPVMVLHTLSVSLVSYRLIRRVSRQNQLLDELRRIDALTGLYDRGHWQEQAEATLRRHHATDEPACLVMLDIDHFKQINDQHGHTVGDEVLRALARIVLSNVRATDCAGRYGGDEFAIVLRGMHLDGATAVAHRIREQVQALQLHDMPGLQFTTSMGVATADHRHSSLRAWTNAADAELYQAKAAGRNRVSASSMPDMAPVV
ncbi:MULTISPECIES: sensor domain-containing diguanylate cyclase [unclassified Acidovorax]|jgi:diguanylate cyclase|uniref:sensor domain-containing diguanylate cyclase n=1 Tax=unclassified Acidovorax TaxID=2684926 RepID=UPI000BDC2753|nr:MULTISPECIES: sensor domain-containing diguanylate cyclase [unclassified Acidovorax]OZA55543.1 MAG: diguanylate cyclase AdrA [Acidovorax sp. 17-64-282]HQS21774.1 diguanylate cyclase [Acidovorax defluvii]MBP7959614.1 diguanylate cyclase [Acidovorax sp.]OYY28301.1 MAG: diguanylate cyclase AdrA [Acidovorax sp. 35-64-16]OYY87171.1 MAG: diguanylate cyclase AdrA [Acidovorax sp. 28-64-14]